MNEEERIKEIRALCEKATPGAWMGLRAAYEDCLLIKCDKDEYLMSQHDAAFIACSREDVPFLLDYIADLEKQLYASQRRERAAVEDMKLIVDAVREEYCDETCCFACKFDCDTSITDSGVPNCECPGFERDDCFEWRGVKEEME